MPALYPLRFLPFFNLDSPSHLWLVNFHLSLLLSLPPLDSGGRPQSPGGIKITLDFDFSLALRSALGRQFLQFGVPGWAKAGPNGP